MEKKHIVIFNQDNEISLIDIYCRTLLVNLNILENNSLKILGYWELELADSLEMINSHYF